MKKKGLAVTAALVVVGGFTTLGLNLTGMLASSAQSGNVVVPTTTTPCPPGPPPPDWNAPPCVPGNNADNSPASQANAAKTWPVTGTGFISEGAAIQAAETTHATHGPAHALLTMYYQAAQLMKESPDPEVNPETKVWIVTVTANPGQPFAGGDSTSPYFTIIMDAVNGVEIDDCTGCDTITTG